MLLRQCDGDSDEILIRLAAVLLCATGLDGRYLPGSTNSTSGIAYAPSFSVKFPKTVRAVERINLWFEHDTVKLACWPAELKAQYTAVYSSTKSVEALVAAEAKSSWWISPNFQLAFPFSAPAMRWYPRRKITGAAYVTQWVDDFRNHRAGARERSFVEESAFWGWLVDRRYATTEDRPGFETWISKQPARRQIHIRPGFEISREWSLAEAVALDAAGQLVSEVRECVDNLLDALGAPSLHRTTSGGLAPGAQAFGAQ